MITILQTAINGLRIRNRNQNRNVSKVRTGTVTFQKSEPEKIFTVRFHNAGI